MRLGLSLRLICAMIPTLTTCQSSPSTRCGEPAMMSPAPTLTTRQPIETAAFSARLRFSVTWKSGSEATHGSMRGGEHEGSMHAWEGHGHLEDRERRLPPEVDAARVDRLGLRKVDQLVRVRVRVRWGYASGLG